MATARFICCLSEALECRRESITRKLSPRQLGVSRCLGTSRGLRLRLGWVNQEISNLRRSEKRPQLFGPILCRESRTWTVPWYGSGDDLSGNVDVIEDAHFATVISVRSDCGCSYFYPGRGVPAHTKVTKRSCVFLASQAARSS